jgi:hypothetical protein
MAFLRSDHLRRYASKSGAEPVTADDITADVDSLGA